MAASYKKLFKLLIDRDMKKKELAEKSGISIATITKMSSQRKIHKRRDMCAKFAVIRMRVRSYLPILSVLGVNTLPKISSKFLKTRKAFPCTGNAFNVRKKPQNRIKRQPFTAFDA